MDHSESQPTQQSSFDADLSAPMVDHLSKGWGWVRIICEGQVREEALCDSEITIGRRSTNKIQIKHSAISGEHCTIIYDQATRLACVRDHSTNGTYLNNERIPPNTTPFLNNRAIITLVRMGPECVSVQLSYNQPAYESEVPSPMGIYIITKPLGAGAFAQVFQCMHNSTGQLYALKIIEKKKYLKLTEHSRTTRTDTLNDEVNILYGLNHPNVIGVKQTFDSEQYLYTVLELVTGGDLFDKLLAQPERCFPEEEAHDYFAQLAHAIAYLHDKDIVHRDLKPENILLASPHSRQIKLADFGLSRVVRSGSVMTTICGTPQYLAPEVLDTQISAEGYSKAVDMWSIGVILYVLLSGNTPYSEENVEDLRARLRMFTPSFVGEIWNRVSSSAKDLITRLLEVDPSKRMTVHECLEHPWLSAFYSVHAAAAAAAVVAQETTVRIQPQPSNVVMREPSVYPLDADETKEVVAVGNGSNGPTTSSTAVASAEVSGGSSGDVGGGGNGESSPLALLRPSVSDMSAPVEPSASAIMMGSRKRRPCDREPASTSDSKRTKDGEC